MRINHIAVYVYDLEKTKKFYETYFDGKPNDRYHNPKTGLETHFLSFENGCKLEIMTKPNILTIENSNERTGYIHLAFSVGNKESVDDLTARLRDDGYTIFSEPRMTGDGYYESCVSDPDGNRIEIVT